VAFVWTRLDKVVLMLDDNLAYILVLWFGENVEFSTLHNFNP